MKLSQLKKLSLAVFCKGVSSILEIQLQALKKQSLSKDLWEPVFLFRANLENHPQSGSKAGVSLNTSVSKEAFLKHKKQIQKFFPQAKILILKLNHTVYELRNLVFKEIKSPLIYFLDEDVILDKNNHLETVLNLHDLNPSLTAIGGAYLDHPESSFFGKIYNWIVRIWMKKHQSSARQDLLPAGNFSIKNHPGLKVRFYSPNPSGFGAEELFFFKSLHKEGFLSSWMTQLDAKHLAQHRFKDFIQRAWLQGQSLPAKDWFSKRNSQVFLQEPAPLAHKGMALLYLLLARLSAVQRRFFWKETSIKERESSKNLSQ